MNRYSSLKFFCFSLFEWFFLLTNGVAKNRTRTFKMSVLDVICSVNTSFVYGDFLKFGCTPTLFHFAENIAGVCVCVYALVCACVRACVRACMCECVRTFIMD